MVVIFFKKNSIIIGTNEKRKVSYPRDTTIHYFAENYLHNVYAKRTLRENSALSIEICQY